jgi:hypothetical protein
MQRGDINRLPRGNALRRGVAVDPHINAETAEDAGIAEDGDVLQMLLRG